VSQAFRLVPKRSQPLADRISRNAVYDMVAREEITAVKVGQLLRIPAKPFHSKFGDAIPLTGAHALEKIEK
jgi:hypothetical protein